MIKINLSTLLISIYSLFLIAYDQPKDSQPKDDPQTAAMKTYMDLISSNELNASLHFLASDYFEGRATGTRGQIAAAHYLASSLASIGVLPLKTGSPTPLEDYFQTFPFQRGTQKGTSQNVLGYIEGSDPKLKEEIIVLSAHYDHLGRNEKLEGDQIFNGAADDGSGAVSLLEIAESLALAKANGFGLKRSVLIALFSGEEIGLQGSFYYVAESPALPLMRVVADVNLDGVAGYDLEHPKKSRNYVYILQIDSIASHLGILARELNSTTGINLDLDPPLHPESFGSDSQPFESMLIPTIYFSTGLTEHYHKVTDEPGTIDYLHMSKIVKLIFALTWNVGNAIDLKPTLNKADYQLTGKYFCAPCGCDKDKTIFDGPGRCPSCTMQLYPQWAKK